MSFSKCFCQICIRGYWDSSFCTDKVVGWRKFLAGAKGFSPLKGPRTSLVPTHQGSFFSGVKRSRLAAHDSLPCIDKVQNVWRLTSTPICYQGAVLNWIRRQLYLFNFPCSHSLNTTNLSSICHPFLSTIVQLDRRPVAYISTNTEYPPNETRHRAGIFRHEHFTEITFRMLVTLPSFLKMHLRRYSSWYCNFIRTRYASCLYKSSLPRKIRYCITSQLAPLSGLYCSARLL